jgi:hypothetical protein
MRSVTVPELEWLELARIDLLGVVDYISDNNAVWPVKL